MSTYFSLTSSEGILIFTSLLQEHDQLFDLCSSINELVVSNSKNKSFRHGKIKNEQGTAYLISFDKELIERPRYFKEKLSVLSEQIETIAMIKSELKNDMQADNRRLIHNITSFNGKNILELYSIVPENQVTGDFRKLKETIKTYLKDNPDGVADAFLRIAKNSIAMKSEFTVFKKLEGDPSLLQKQLYDIRKVILLVIHVFYHDFKENDIYVQVDECDSKVNFDFESIRVALYHLLDNTAKYIMPNTQLRIGFIKKDKFTVQFSMWSMEIKTDELKLIEQEGFSGTWAKKTGKSGDGLGISIVKRILAMNSAELIVTCGQQNQIKRMDGVNYTRNQFDLVFN